jgi:hypothetical protein
MFRAGYFLDGTLWRLVQSRRIFSRVHFAFTGLALDSRLGRSDEERGIK